MRGIKMFSVGQNVLYGINGVCVVQDITEKKVGKLSMEYYVLKPLDTKTSTLFVPTNNEELCNRIRNVLSKESIDNILSNLPEVGDWNDNKQERSEEFKNTVHSGDCLELIKMIRLINTHGNELAESGRHLHMSDERFLKDAEKMVSEEVALALNVDRQTAIELVLQ